jgi:hypothetical protein
MVVVTPEHLLPPLEAVAADRALVRQRRSQPVAPYRGRRRQWVEGAERVPRVKVPTPPAPHRSGRGAPQHTPAARAFAGKCSGVGFP